MGATIQPLVVPRDGGAAGAADRRVGATSGARAAGADTRVGSARDISTTPPARIGCKATTVPPGAARLCGAAAGASVAGARASGVGAGAGACTYRSTRAERAEGAAPARRPGPPTGRDASVRTTGVTGD